MKPEKKSQLAEAAIRLAMQRIAKRYPFHVAILERFVLRCRTDVGTMAVTVEGNDVVLLYNPEFVTTIHADKLGGVLLHETHHILFRHPLARAADYPDAWARTIAEEITVNEFVKEPLPEGAILLEHFPELTPMQSTDERYDLLAAKEDREPISEPGNLGVVGDDGPAETEPMPGNSPGCADAAQSTAGEAPPGSTRTTLDNHTVWSEITDDPAEAGKTIESLVHEAALEVGGEGISDDLRSALCSEGVGDLPGTDQYRFQGGGRSRVNWRTVLRCYVDQILEIRPTFTSPSRRFPDLVGVFPGKQRRTGYPKIMVAIDTSESITDELLEAISAELDCLARHYEVTVVECDAAIQDVHPYRPLDVVKGRGGTDFGPVFDKNFLRQHRPDLIVYFTDGFGDAPTWPPSIRVIWCLTPDGEKPTSWGRAIFMEE